MKIKDKVLIQISLGGFTKREQKLLIGILDKILKDKMSQITLDIDDLCAILEYNRRSVWTNIKSIISRLQDRILNINGTSYKIFYNLEYNQGLLIADLNPQLYPYLTKLYNKFIKINRDNCLHFRSRYTLPLYQRLLMAKNMSTLTISVNEICALLRTNPNQEYWQLKHRIIIPALDEINTVLDVDYVPVRHGRKVVAIKFIFGITRINKAIKYRNKKLHSPSIIGNKR